MRVFLNLRAGLDRLGVSYRVNDFGHARRHADEVACIVGKPFLLDQHEWKNPILFGAAVPSHPLEDPRLLDRSTVRRILVPGEWMRRMFAEYYGDRVAAWPVGIDTDRWSPAPAAGKDIDVLLYDKVRWQRDRFEPKLIAPVHAALVARGLRVATIRYGQYEEEEFQQLLARSRAMVFLCEHETQGIAYQQALSAGVPILAWDRGGPWQDPSFYPRVVFEEVSSVPYWDERCGERFRTVGEFDAQLDVFIERLGRGAYDPRQYILDNLTLEMAARAYLEQLRIVERELARAGTPQDSAR